MTEGKGKDKKKFRIVGTEDAASAAITKEIFGSEGRPEDEEDLTHGMFRRELPDNGESPPEAFLKVITEDFRSSYGDPQAPPVMTVIIYKRNDVQIHHLGPAEYLDYGLAAITDMIKARPKPESGPEGPEDAG